MGQIVRIRSTASEKTCTTSRIHRPTDWQSFRACANGGIESCCPSPKLSGPSPRDRGDPQGTP
eukprot:6414963-Pyramimonas_sp.AAC.1